MKPLPLTLAAVLLLWAPSVAAQDPKLVAAGKKTYDSKKCAECHSIAGKGKKIAPLDGISSKISADEMRKWLTNPAEMEATLKKKQPVKMSSKKIALTPAEVDGLIAYIQTLK